MTTTHFLQRPDGRIAYDVAGVGPLVVCLPGMSEIRQSFRHLVPLLVEAGFKVATMDLRGHGDSDDTFTSYDDEALAADALALIDALGGAAYIVGNSMGAAAGVIAAADRPDAVTGLVLVGPFVRDGVGAFGKLLFRVMLTKPWGVAAWMSYYPKWFPGERPADYQEHTALVRANITRHWPAFVKTSRTTHSPAQARLGDVKAPSVVVMGTDDVDWKDPAAEAAWIADQLGADLVMAPGVGHYPQAQAPSLVVEAVVRLTAGGTHA